MDALFENKGKGPKDVDWYKERLAKMDRKVLNAFNGAYDTLHLAMGYDGNPVASVSVVGLEIADSIISWVETRTAVA